MADGGPINRDEAAERIANALDRIERAAAFLEARNAVLRDAAKDAVADLDRLIGAAVRHG